MAHGHSHHAEKTKHKTKKHASKGVVMKEDRSGKAEGFHDEYAPMHEFSKSVHSGKHAKKMCHGGKM